MHACFDDIEAILDICQEAHDLSPHYRHIPSDRHKARASLAQMILNPHMLVAFNGNGVLIAVAAPSWWGDGLVISDVFFYARKGGRTLLREYLKWARAFPGNNQISIGVTFGGEAGERAEQLYRRLGFEQSGTIFKVTT